MEAYLDGKALKPWQNWLNGFTAIVIGLALIALPWLTTHKEILLPFTKKDVFATASLGAEPGWQGGEWLLGVFYILLFFSAIGYMKDGYKAQGLAFLFGSSALIVLLGMWFHIRKVEAFSQRAMIDFCKTLADKTVYIETWGFKSYAHLFYAKVKPECKPTVNSVDMKWVDAWRQKLLNTEMDREVFIISKVNDTVNLRPWPNLQLLYTKNGFAFYRKNTAILQENAPNK
jgi:hypothetical protein